MKSKNNVIVRLVLIAFVAIASGCELDDLEIPAELDTVWDVNITAESTDADYALEKTVELIDDPEVALYIDRLKGVQLEKITYRVVDYVAGPNDVILKDLQVDFRNASGSSTVGVSIGDINLKTTTVDTDLGVSQEHIDFIAGLLKDEKEVTVKVAGTLSSTPVACKIVFTFHASITASALK